MRAIIFPLLLLAAPAWAVNKCAGLDGRPIFQDAPCADGRGSAAASATQAPKPAAVMAPEDMARSFETQLERPETQKKMQENVERRRLMEKADAAIRSGDRQKCGEHLQAQPSVGMTEARFLACTQFARDWEHLQIHETETQNGVSKQYVYARHAPIRYVYIDRGRITAIGR